MLTFKFIIQHFYSTISMLRLKVLIKKFNMNIGVEFISLLK